MKISSLWSGRFHCECSENLNKYAHLKALKQKRKDVSVMPTRTLKIENGPGFRGFVNDGGVVSSIAGDTSFIMDQKNPEDMISKRYQLTLRAIGNRLPQKGTRDKDHFWFIATRVWVYHPTLMPKPDNTISLTDYHWYRCVNTVYIGNYNVRDRTGECKEMPLKDFLETNPHMNEVMLP